MSCSTKLRIIAIAAITEWVAAICLLIAASLTPGESYLDGWGLFLALGAATLSVWHIVMQHASRVSRAFQYGLALGTPPTPPHAAERERERERERESRVVRAV